LCHTEFIVEAWESIAERKIQEAIEAGEFDNLPHRGKPIRIEANPFEDPTQWMAHHLLRVNGFAPAWIEEASEIDRITTSLLDDIANSRQRHATDPPDWQRARDGFRQRLDEINRRILAYNLKCPSVQFQKRLVELP